MTFDYPIHRPNRVSFWEDHSLLLLLLCLEDLSLFVDLRPFVEAGADPWLLDDDRLKDEES